MSTELFSLRQAGPADIAAIDRLLERSYPLQLRKDYPPSVMVTAIPLLTRANPTLIARGTYYVIETAAGQAVAAGGWTLSRRSSEAGDIRHVVTHPDYLRRGLGRKIVETALSEARASGLSRMNCHAALGAVPFYHRLGFEALGPEVVSLRPGITFEAMRMLRPL